MPNTNTKKNNNMIEKVQAILARQTRLDAEKITPQYHIKRDLGADSVDILQLLMKVEDTYGIVIPDEALAGFETVQDVVTFLEKQEAKL